MVMNNVCFWVVWLSGIVATLLSVFWSNILTQLICKHKNDYTNSELYFCLLLFAFLFKIGFIMMLCVKEMF